jgi:hypothetical protein
MTRDGVQASRHAPPLFRLPRHEVPKGHVDLGRRDTTHVAVTAQRPTALVNAVLDCEVDYLDVRIAFEEIGIELA